MTTTTCRATMAMHYTDALYVEGRHTMHLCGLSATHTRDHICACGHAWTSLPIGARCHACGHTVIADIEVTNAVDEDETNIVMCTDVDACTDRVRTNAHTITAGRGEGATRTQSVTETPRPVANSLSDEQNPTQDVSESHTIEHGDPVYPVADDVPDGREMSTSDMIDRLRQEPSQSLTDGQGNRYAMGSPGRMSPAPDEVAAARRQSTTDALKSGRETFATGGYIRGPRDRQGDLIARQPGRTSWPYGPDHIHIDPPRRFMSDTRFTPGVQVSEVETHTSRGRDLQGLWQRTVDIIRTQVDSLTQLAENMPGHPAEADIRTSVLELLTARINVERLRPASDADVTGRLAALTSSVDALREQVEAFDRAPVVKPASYLVDGLEPHRFRNDGSDPDQNACTFEYSTYGPADPVMRQCGYGANAQVHRRVGFLGKNAPAMPTAEPSIQERPRVFEPGSVQVMRDHGPSCQCKIGSSIVDLNCVTGYAITVVELS